MKERLEKLRKMARQCAGNSLAHSDVVLRRVADELESIANSAPSAQEYNAPEAYLTDEGALLPVCFSNEYRARGAILTPLVAAPSQPLDGIRVRLCAPTTLEPFRQLECTVVDVDHSDRSLVVKCKELEKEQANSAQYAQPEVVVISAPDYHEEGMGCGLEDRGITDRYEAMRYGWDCAIERMFEQIPEGPLYTAPPAESAKVLV